MRRSRSSRFTSGKPTRLIKITGVPIPASRGAVCRESAQLGGRRWEQAGGSRSLGFGSTARSPRLNPATLMELCQPNGALRRKREG